MCSIKCLKANGKGYYLEFTRWKPLILQTTVRYPKDIGIDKP